MTDLFKAIFGVVSDVADTTVKVAASAADLTKDVVVTGVKITGKAVDLTSDVFVDTAKLTTNVVMTTADMTGKVLGAGWDVTSSLFDSGLEKLKEPVKNYAKNYLLSYFLHDYQFTKLEDRIDHSLNFAFAQFLISPFERARILLQTQDIRRNAKTEKYSGLFDCVFKEMRNKGFLRLWRGSLPLTIYHLLYFNSIDYRLKTVFDMKSTPTSETFQSFTKIYLFDFLLMSLFYPFETLSSRISSDHRETISEGKFQIYKKYSSPNLFNGFLSSFYFLTSKTLILFSSVVYLSKQGCDNLEFFYNLVFFMYLAEFLAYPFDLVKRRQMVQSCSENFQSKYNKGILATFKTIYNEEHIPGFFKGAFLKFTNFTLRRGIFVTSLSYYYHYKLNYDKKE